MNDTSRKIEQQQFELMMSLGPKKRIELACEMYMTAREFILASLPRNLSDDERLHAFLDKMYGKKFAERFFNDGNK